MQISQFAVAFNRLLMVIQFWNRSLYGVETRMVSLPAGERYLMIRPTILLQD